MYRKSLTIIALLFTFSFAYYHTNIACVGVVDYPGKKNELRLSVADTQIMSDLYHKNGNAMPRTQAASRCRHLLHQHQH